MRLIPVAPDGWRFILPLAFLSSFSFWLATRFDFPWVMMLAGLIMLSTLFCLFFFRDFDRATKPDENIIYSPGDGKILEVSTLKDGKYAGGTIIRIFLSVFNGHVQRSPIQGRIESMTYQKGTFLDARDPSAHVQNEQNALMISSPKGKVLVTQIAGLIARRIVCWVKEGQELKQGERFGLIRFGSQVDVVIPAATQVLVHVGQCVCGGSTVLAQW